MHCEEEEKILSFMPNAALFLIPPLLYCSGAAMRLNVKKNNLIVDGKLRDCFCGVFIKSVSSYDNDKVYILTRNYEREDTEFTFSLMEHPLYHSHYRVFINNLYYNVIVYKRNDLIQDTIDALDGKPLTCLPIETQKLIKYYWSHDDIETIFSLNNNTPDLYSMRSDIMPLSKPYEFHDGSEWISDKKYLEGNLYKYIPLREEINK